MEYDFKLKSLLQALKSQYKDLQEKSRNGDKESQKYFSWLIWKCLPSRENLLPEAEDEPWLSELAEESYFPAIYIYLNSEMRTYKTWTEDFVDEDTGETYQAELTELTNSTSVFNISHKKAEALVAKYFDRVYTEREKDIYTLKEDFEHLSKDFHFLGIYSDRKSKFIEILEILSTSDVMDINMYYCEYLADIYHNGLEQIGIFRDDKKSSKYYQLLLETKIKRLSELKKECDWRYHSYPYDNPRGGRWFTLHIIGSDVQYKNIETLFNQILQNTETPYDNTEQEKYIQLGLGMMIKKLVGKDNYIGDLEFVSKNSEELTLCTYGYYEDANALKFALIEAYGPMEIDIETNI